MKKHPKIILWDIETLPNLDKALEHWVNLDCQWKKVPMTATVSTIICVGWKNLHSKKIHCINAWDYKRWSKDKNDDYDVCKAAYDVLHDADGIVTHNGKKFDYKFLNTRLMHHGLPLLPKIPHIDTKVMSSRNLTIVNNRLGSVAEFFKVDGKMQNGGWKLWVDVHNGSKKARKTMEKYCKQDVNVLEMIFNKMKPFAGNIPNYNQFTGLGKESRVCPSCGSGNLEKNGLRRTKTTVFQRYRCKDCGSNCQTNSKDMKPVSI